MKLALLLLASMVGLLRADEFAFSYDFANATVFSGTFSGTAVDGLVADASDFTIKINGLDTPYRTSTDHPVFALSLSWPTPTEGVYGTSPVFSFDVGQNNFVFADVDLSTSNMSTSWWLGVYDNNGTTSAAFTNAGWGVYTLPDGSRCPLPFEHDADDVALQSSWQLTDLTTGATSDPPIDTPDGTATALLLFCSVGGLIALRARRI
ncbi:MAG TPA: hypothetical protein VHD32_11475 [Candidatus Didemnitutus sp.]|nr:hypothetical protein [Candidatus Didemnitutus sp.]